ncbi:sodium/potassium-transporting ATPase subunit beta-1-interacting protein 3-like, partial [Saccoglossus kowalevskii]|uniref:Sodium/potassium-transporting ATPase subunit beta-1-interacting protein n=1 Tax=Saccoglossus kowalevskii TaxID=10224 RepID=A0ABM0M0K0_SACKO
MGCCTARCTLITICVLQLIGTVERQVFDFLGYMWAPIIGNFLHIIFVILGLFGAYQYRPRYIIVYAVWLVIWLVWNTFIICMYLEVGALSIKNHKKILTINTDNESWWTNHGYGCVITYNTTTTANGETHQETSNQDCILDYEYVEIIHAGIQCLFC